MSSVSCCTICNSISLFPSRPIPHHPTSSHLSHHSYIFISLGFSSYTANGKSTLYEVGETLTAIQRAFSGWDAGDEYAVTPFRRIASPSIEYNDGFAFYPISFACDTVQAAN